MSTRILPVLLFISTIAMGGGGDHGGNGGGPAEKNVIFAYLNLAKYIDMCMNSQACRINHDDRKLLPKIKNSLATEGSADKLIVFDSELRRPGFFVLDGAVKIAKTGNQIGSPIYVNIDLLYRRAREAAPSVEPGTGLETLGGSNLIPISVPSAAALLIHELGHHHGVKDHVALDALGSKVESLLLNDTQILRSWDGATRNLEITAIHDSTEGYTQVLVSDGESVLDLCEMLKRGIKSPDDHKALVKGFRIWNIHWYKAYRTRSGWDQQVWGRLELVLQGADGNTVGVGRAFNVVIYLALNSKDGGFAGLRLNEKAIRFEQLRCGAPGVFCH